MILNEKDKVVEVRIETAIDLTEGNAVWVGDEDFQVAELSNADVALGVVHGQGNEAVKRHSLNVDFQFFCRLYNYFVQIAWVNIVTPKVKING